MYKTFKLALAFFASFIALFLFTSQTKAYEGEAKIRSLNGEEYRCWAPVTQREDLKYTIQVSCRNLIYPADTNIYSYVMWAVPQDGSTHKNLGVLGFGKAQFRYDKPITTLYVTTEGNPQVKQPTGPVVMRGDVERITFLDEVSSPTPTPEGNDDSVPTIDGTDEDQPMSTRDKLVLGLKRAGLISFFALVVIVGLVFVITRARG